MTDIVVTDITTGSVSGTGVFDKLMLAVKAHISQEYDAGRIKGSDYATVYLGALQSVLTQSVEFVLKEKLLEVQIEGAIKDNKIKYAQQVKLDKETAMLGLDDVLKNQNITPQAVYTPKYEATV